MHALSKPFLHLGSDIKIVINMHYCIILLSFGSCDPLIKMSWTLELLQVMNHEWLILNSYIHGSSWTVFS